MNEWSLLAILAGFLLDLLIGDPHQLYHPVRLVGKLITLLERLLRRCFPGTERGERAAGLCLAILVPAITGAAALALLYIGGRISPWLAFALEVIMSYQLFAVRALRDESMKVYRELRREDLPGARRAVSMIVGRDTERLDEQGRVEELARLIGGAAVTPALMKSARELLQQAKEYKDSK